MEDQQVEIEFTIPYRLESVVDYLFSASFHMDETSYDEKLVIAVEDSVFNIVGCIDDLDLDQAMGLYYTEVHTVFQSAKDEYLNNVAKYINYVFENLELLITPEVASND